MSNAWQWVRDSFFFFRHHAKALALLILPIAIPVLLLVNYRMWAVLGGDLKAVQDDAILSFSTQLLWVFATACTFIYTLGVAKGETKEPSLIRKEALFKVPELFLIAMMIQLAVIVGLLLLVIPGIWVWGCFAAAQVIVIAENRNIFEAISESFSRFKAKAFVVAFAFFLLSLLLFVGLILFFIAVGLIGLGGDSAGLALKIGFGTLASMVIFVLLQIVPILMVRVYDAHREA